MPELELVYFPDERLKQPCEPVVDFDDELSDFIDDMFDRMYASGGVGLAAPQVGVLKQVTVIDVEGSGAQKIELVNPKIVETEGKVKSDEGCLSIPGFKAIVQRHEYVKVEGQNRHGDTFELEAKDLLSYCLQHEIDHLNGILFVDHLSRLKREMFKKWCKKNEIL